MSSNILSPRSGQVFPAGKDIPIEAVATDLSGVGQIIILVNNKQIARDTQAPYTAVISKPVPGQYVIQSYATNKYGDNKLSSLVTITVK